MPAAERHGHADTIAGLMAAASIFLATLAAWNVDFTISGVHLSFEPVKVGVPAIALAVLAAWIGGRHARLATFAVFYSTACWVLGMAIAVVTERPLY